MRSKTYRIETPSGQGFYIEASSAKEALIKFKKLSPSPAVKISRWL
ncbi:hypothetical protein [Laspinema olomoucense]|nr:hypothetical protein [Laspinema sp. D3d]MCT7975185.1 hypothetical protein [Laspinema sp. D3d]